MALCDFASRESREAVRSVCELVVQVVLSESVVKLPDTLSRAKAFVTCVSKSPDSAAPVTSETTALWVIYHLELHQKGFDGHLQSFSLLH